MKPLTIVTNNGLRACHQFAKHAIPAGRLNTVGSVHDVLKIPEGEEIVIARYGVGRVKCEVCTAAEILVRQGHLTRVYRDEIKLDVETSEETS